MTKSLPDTEQWLSLGDAAKQLGVHNATLRRWADDGEIPCMLTPGGHRRFMTADVERFAQQRRQAAAPAAIEQLWAERAMTQTRQELVEHRQKPWLAVQDDQLREQHRLLGQRLMGLTLQFISDENGNLLQEAATLGTEYGRLAQATQLPLTDALQATIFFRDMLVETALQLPESVHIKPEANLRLMRRINELLNTVHLAIAAVYEA